MSSPLVAFPQRAHFGRILAKAKLLERGPNAKIRDALSHEVEQIRWAYKLAPETLNLEARPAVPEIQIFHLHLRQEEVSEELLRFIDQSIPFPLLLELQYQGKVKLVAAYKTPVDAENTKWQLSNYLSSNWIAEDIPRRDLPAALNLAKLYEALLQPLIPVAARPEEAFETHLQRFELWKVKQREIAKLQAKIQQERQFNRKVELHNKLRQLSAEAQSLQ